MYFGGYNKIFSWEEDDEVIRLKEIQICATPEELKKIGKFFLDTADEMDSWGDKFGHNHLKFDVKEFNGWDKPDIAIYRRPDEAG